MSSANVTSEGRVPLQMRKSVFLRVKRDRSVAASSPPAPSVADDGQNSIIHPSSSTTSNNNDVMNVKIDGVTYHFERLTESMWSQRMAKNNHSKGPRDDASAAKTEPLSEINDNSAPKEKEPADLSAPVTKEPKVENQRSGPNPATPDKREADPKPLPLEKAAASHVNHPKQNDEKSLELKDPVALLSDSTPLESVQAHHGPKYKPDASKQRNLDKLTADAHARRKVLRLSSVQCCRLGAALTNGKGKAGTMGVLISAVEGEKQKDKNKSGNNNNKLINAATSTQKSAGKMNALKDVRPDDLPLVMAGIEADEIMDDLYEQVMAVERQLQLRGGRSLTDDELDELIKTFKKKSLAKKETERAATQSSVPKPISSDTTVGDVEVGGDYDYYVLTREEQQEDLATQNAYHGDGFYDGYDLIGEDDDPTGSDEFSHFNEDGHDVANNHGGLDEEDTLDDTDDQAADHLTYNFDTMTLRPHYQQQHVKWHQQPVEVAIWQSNNDDGKNVTNDDDFDFNEMVRGPQNSYQLQAPTIKGAVQDNKNTATRLKKSQSLLHQAASHLKDFVAKNESDNTNDGFQSNSLAVKKRNKKSAAEEFIASFFGNKKRGHVDPYRSTTLGKDEEDDVFENELVLDEVSNQQETEERSVAADFFSGLKWRSGGDEDYASYLRALKREEKRNPSNATKAVTLSNHLATNVGAEDPEVVYQQDDEYDSNAEDHYGNEYADESSDESENSDDGQEDSVHGDELDAMGFGNSNFRLQSKNIDDDDDDDDEEFEGYDRYGDLGHRHVGMKAGYDEDSSAGDYDEGFDDYGRVADDDDDNYNY